MLAKLKKYYVYVIKSIEGFIYTGVTEDLKLRLKLHNEKNLSFSTKRGTNWKVIYQEAFDDKKEALKKELWLKTGAGRDFIKRLM